MKCSSDQCRRDAVCAVAVNVPATGWPIDMHVPFQVMTSIVVCQKHYEYFKSEEGLKGLLGDPDEKSIAQVIAVMCRNKVPPDFSRAYASKVKLDDPTWNTMHGQQS